MGCVTSQMDSICGSKKPPHLVGNRNGGPLILYFGNHCGASIGYPDDRQGVSFAPAVFEGNVLSDAAAIWLVSVDPVDFAGCATEGWGAAGSALIQQALPNQIVDRVGAIVNPLRSALRNLLRSLQFFD